AVLLVPQRDAVDVSGGHGSWTLRAPRTHRMERATRPAVCEASHRTRPDGRGAMTMTADELEQAAADHLWLHFSRLSSVDGDALTVIERGDGAYVWDSTGKRYLDGLAGLFVSQVGH